MEETHAQVWYRGYRQGKKDALAQVEREKLKERVLERLTAHRAKHLDDPAVVVLREDEWLTLRRPNRLWGVPVLPASRVCTV